MLQGRHSVESLLLSLENANIPAERLVGALQCAGFRFHAPWLLRHEGSGYSLGAVRGMIRHRINLARELWRELGTLYEGSGVLRTQDGVPCDGHFNPSPFEDEGAVLARAEKIFWSAEHSDQKKGMLRLWRAERAFIRAVKDGDITIFDEVYS